MASPLLDLLKENSEIIWVEAQRDFKEDTEFELEVGKGEEILNEGQDMTMALSEEILSHG